MILLSGWNLHKEVKFLVPFSIEVDVPELFWANRLDTQSETLEDSYFYANFSIKYQHIREALYCLGDLSIFDYGFYITKTMINFKEVINSRKNRGCTCKCKYCSKNKDKNIIEAVKPIYTLVYHCNAEMLARELKSKGKIDIKVIIL